MRESDISDHRIAIEQAIADGDDDVLKKNVLNLVCNFLIDFNRIANALETLAINDEHRINKERH